MKLRSGSLRSFSAAGRKEIRYILCRTQMQSSRAFRSDCFPHSLLGTRAANWELSAILVSAFCFCFKRFDFLQDQFSTSNDKTCKKNDSAINRVDKGFLDSTADNARQKLPYTTKWPDNNFKEKSCQSVRIFLSWMAAFFFVCTIRVRSHRFILIYCNSTF